MTLHLQALLPSLPTHYHQKNHLLRLGYLPQAAPPPPNCKSKPLERKESSSPLGARLTNIHCTHIEQLHLPFGWLCWLYQQDDRIILPTRV